MENLTNLILQNIFLSIEDFATAKKNFKISDDYGFMTYYDYDLVQLPDFLLPFEEIAAKIDILIKAASIQSIINSMEKIHKEELKLIEDEKVCQKIFSIASSLTNAYLFSKTYLDNEKPIIPANLWALLKHSAEHLELKPVFVLWGPLHVVKRLDKDAEPAF
jgi:hypothetical protein